MVNACPAARVMPVTVIAEPDTAGAGEPGLVVT